MDVRMPVMDRITATQLICAQFPSIKVFVLTTFDDEQYIEKIIELKLLSLPILS